MSVKLLTKHHLEFLSLNEAAQARVSLHLSKCHIVGNRMSRLIYKAIERVHQDQWNLICSKATLIFRFAFFVLVHLLCYLFRRTKQLPLICRKDMGYGFLLSV